MGKLSRQKGKRGEREWAQFIRSEFKMEARRGVQHRGGPDSPDVIHEMRGVHFEVKLTESLNLEKALEQAGQECGPGEVAVVAHRRNNKSWVMSVRAGRFRDLVEAFVNARRDTDDEYLR
jgi:hypothetical protein